MSDNLIWHIHERTIPAALELLPGRMTSPEATAMLLSIGLQESKFQHRRQVGGPAHGFWQFERMGGVAGVLEHPTTQPIITPICDMLLYPATSLACYTALEHHDVLATCFARLLLWTDARTLPAPHEAAKGWAIYLAQWRPGKPHRDTWNANFDQAWQIVQGE
jgi:hypothetical protein